jgi:hypothetical protein
MLGQLLVVLLCGLQNLIGDIERGQDLHKTTDADTILTTVAIIMKWQSTIRITTRNNKSNNKSSNNAMLLTMSMAMSCGLYDTSPRTTACKAPAKTVATAEYSLALPGTVSKAPTVTCRPLEVLIMIIMSS